MPKEPMRIILVEDDEIDAEALRRILEMSCSDSTLTWVTDGMEAYDLLSSNAAPDKPYIVLLDLNMPRMNGHEFMREIRGNPKLKNTVIFVFTTSAAEEDVIEAYENNVAGYVVKMSDVNGYESFIRMLTEYWNTVVLPQ